MEFKKFITTIFIILTIAGPNLIFFDFFFMSQLLLLLIYPILCAKTFKKWNIIFLLLIIFYLFVIIIVNNFIYDFEIIKLPLRILIYSFSAKSIYLLAKQYYSNNEILSLILKIIFFNSLFTISTLIGPLRSFYSEVLVLNEEASFFASQGLRFFDLAIGGQATASVYFGLSILLLRYLSINKLMSSSKHLLYWCFIFSAGIICGRSIFLFLIFDLLLLIYFKKIFSIKNAFFFTCILFVGYYLNDLIIQNNYKLYSWMFEPVLNLLDNKNISASTDILKTMFFLPDQVLFGEANLGRSLVKVKSDIGYVRLIWGYGVLGLLLFTPLFFNSVKIIYKSYRLESIFLSVILFILLLFLYKELWLGSRVLQVYIFLIFIIFKQKKYDNATIS
jgi:hypothetical protein